MPPKLLALVGVKRVEVTYVAGAFDNIDAPMVFLPELVAKFDTVQYFCEVGSKKWPTITMLARIHFSRMDNSAFQERVFSTAANVQEKTQNRMAFEHLEKRTLIAHNKQLLRDKII